jgi:hypothetical protein
MTHDEILNAARERIAALDKQIADLATERARLQALLGAPAPVAPWTRPHVEPVLPIMPPVYPEPYRPYAPWEIERTWGGQTSDRITTTRPDATSITGIQVEPDWATTVTVSGTSLFGQGGIQATMSDAEVRASLNCPIASTVNLS